MIYLFQEGEPNDPQLKRLQREIDEVNRLFDEWERRAAMEEERRNAAKLFNDRCNSLEVSLSAEAGDQPPSESEWDQMLLSV